MKRFLSILMGLVVLSTISLKAQQPFSIAWHPDDLKVWVPGALDSDVFNRSSVPLATRVDITEDFKANANAHKEGRVCALINMNGNCSDTPSQGAASYAVRNFTHWQYIDILVWWGGSSGEGIIVPPSAPVTNIAHKNGVLSYGTVFFPPSSFGGVAAWMNQILEEEGGECPYAKKLAEMCIYYGFDGWFINREGPGDDSHAKWAKFADTFNKYAEPHMGLQWYETGTSMTGKKDLFVDADGGKRFESYFLNYGSAANSNVESNKSLVEEWGRNPFEANFHGIEVGGGGINHGNEFRSMFREDAHYGSMAVFCTQEVKELDSDKPGTDYEKMAKYNQVAQRFWSNISNDVTNTSDFTSSWPGFAAGIISRSAINTKPFITNFNLGHGKARYFEGNKVVTADWYNRGMQDYLPSWVWYVQAEDSKTIEPAYTSEDAYTGGSALQVKGSLELANKNTLRLFKSALPIASGDKAMVNFKQNSTGDQAMKLGLSFTTAPNTIVEFDLPATTGDWQTGEINLSAHAGKTIASINLVFDAGTSAESYDMVVGGISIYAAETACGSVSNITVQNAIGVSETDLRLVWDVATGDVHHYNVYLTSNGVKSLVGQTRDHAFYVGTFDRGGFSATTFSVDVEAVSTTNQVGGSVAKGLDWPAAVAPTVWFSASNTLVAIDDVITLKARTGNYPETITWDLPASATVVSENTDKSEIEVKFSANGVYDITCNAINAGGTTSKTVTGLVEVSESTNLENVSSGKAINFESGHISAHLPTYLIDGDANPGSTVNKWCVGGEKEHSVIVDLQAAAKIYKFMIHDTGVKENAEWNMKNYKIFISNDLENWELVVNEVNRPENIKTDFGAGRVGRYVKLVCYDTALEITLRIWEFEVFAYEPGYTITGDDNAVLDVNKVKDIVLDYSLNGVAKEANFEVQVSASNDLVSAEVLSVDEANKKINVRINSGDSYGESTVTVELKNGEFGAVKTIGVKLTDPNWMNILPMASEKKALALIASDGSVIKDHSADCNKALDDVTDGDFIDYKYSGGHVAVIHTFEVSYDKSYDLFKLELWFKSSSYAKFPKTIKLLTSTDGTEWNVAEEVTPDALMVNWTFAETHSSSNFKVEMHYDDGYDDECELYEIKGFGKVSSATPVNNLKGDTFKVSVFPTPVVDQANVALNLVKAGKVTIDIFNIVGAKEAQAFNGELSAGTHVLPLNSELISGLNSGIYIVVVTTPEGKKTIKISKK